MMKKIAALAATVLSLSILSFSPAHAALVGIDVASCSTTDGAVAPETRRLELFTDSPGYFKAWFYFDDSRQRAWSWKIFRDGDVVAQGDFDLKGEADGARNIVRTLVNPSGENTVRFRIVNASGSVVCNAAVTTSAG